MARPLEDARAVREGIRAAGFDIYEPLAQHPALVYTRAQLEALLRHELLDEVFAGPIRTRSKHAKQAVCRALGYSAPSSFRRIQPRLPAQDLDVYVQQSDNLQIWNEEVSPTRRYVVVRVDGSGRVLALRVVEGTQLAVLDKTGTLTSKYQARRRPGGTASQLVSSEDTANFVAELAPVDHLPEDVLAKLLPGQAPVRRSVLTVRALYERLLPLVGTVLPHALSERVRGEALHRLACETLNLGSYADTGAFPDVVCQALEVKLQTASTIDLGLVTPNSEEPAVTLSPRLLHRDARYLVAYAASSAEGLRIKGIVVSTGADFFTEFRRFGGLVQNRKLQLPLPRGFFEAE